MKEKIKANEKFELDNDFNIARRLAARFRIKNLFVKSKANINDYTRIPLTYSH